MDLDRVLAVIPARYASSRLPGKPLLKIGDWSMIRHVYERVRQLMPHVVVATDDERILSEVTSFGGCAVMTSTHHKSGTDRVREALDIMEKENGAKYDLVINVQGDEPFVSHGHLTLLIEAFKDDRVDIATLVHPFPFGVTSDELANPNQVKVVRSSMGRALYFSRSVIPYERNKTEMIYYKHIGLYAYRSHVLRELTELPINILETTEGLEQLRWLDAGYAIQTQVTHEVSIGIDTIEDLEVARAYFDSLSCKYHD